MNNNKNTQIPKSTFDKMNTKSDPSQNGSPIPFQAGDFASANNEPSSKSAAEIIIFYVVGIILSIVGYLALVNLSAFENVLNDTKLSFLILGAIIIVSFTISKIIQVIFTKSKLKRRI